MKLGVICDGISRDLHRALSVMTEFGLEYAELQFVWNHEVGSHSSDEVALIKDLLDRHAKKPSCLSRHLFAGLTVANRPGDELHSRHMEDLKRMIGLARQLGSPLVRIMTPKKETIIWGAHGAEIWNVARGAWDKTLELMAPAIELAKSEGIKLVVETGNGTMVNSAYAARRLIDDLDSLDVLQALWDPANCCWCHDVMFPDAYNLLRDGYIGHIHLKDVIVDTPRSRLEVTRFGDGQLGPMLEDLAEALVRDGYEDVISYESVYHPGNGSFEDGFRGSIKPFMTVFGADND